MITTKIRYYIDYFLPREVMGPVLVIFSMENIIEIIFTKYAPFQSELFGWFIILLLSILIIGYWGESDEEIDDLENEIKELEKKGSEKG